MRTLTVAILTLLTLTGKSQDCSIEDHIHLILKSSVESDIYYYLDFEKDNVPSGELKYFNDRMDISEDGINDLDLSKTALIERVELNMLSKNHISKKPKFVVFNSGIIGDKVLFEVLFYREDYLLDQSATENYKKYRRFNAGIRYLFELNEEGCVVSVNKSAVNYG